MSDKVKFPEWKGLNSITDREIDGIVNLNRICHDDESERELARLYLNENMRAKYFENMILWMQENRDFCVCNANEIFGGIMISDKNSCQSRHSCPYLNEKRVDNNGSNKRTNM